MGLTVNIAVGLTVTGSCRALVTFSYASTGTNERRCVEFRTPFHDTGERMSTIASVEEVL